MNKIKMATLDELEEGKIVEKRILARRIAVTRLNGEIIGFESECKHMKASMAKGKIEEGVITCPWHHWRYDLNTGKCINVDKFKLKKYEIVIEDNNVFIII